MAFIHSIDIFYHVVHWYNQLHLNTQYFKSLLTRAPPVVLELLRKSFWRRAGFEPTEIESCNLWRSALPPSQDMLDSVPQLVLSRSCPSYFSSCHYVIIWTKAWILLGIGQLVALVLLSFFADCCVLNRCWLDTPLLEHTHFCRVVM